MKNYQTLFKKYAKYSSDYSISTIKAYKLDNLLIGFMEKTGIFVKNLDNPVLDTLDLSKGIESIHEIEIIRITLDKLHLEEQLQFNSGKKKIHKL